MKTFIKSSSKMPTQPVSVYKRKCELMFEKICELHAECDMIDPTGVATPTREEAAIRHKIETMRHKLDWMHRNYNIALMATLSEDDRYKFERDTLRARMAKYTN